LSDRLNKLDENIKVLGRSLEIIWRNQRELSKSEELLDEQFAVSTRMTISNFNSLVSRWNKALPLLLANPEGRAEYVQMLIGYSDVNKLFMEWAEFRKRRDFRQYMPAWFMGDDLSELPPGPVDLDTAKKGEDDVSDSRVAAGESSEGEQAVQSAASEGPPAAVPSV